MEDEQISNSPRSGRAFDPFRDRIARDIRNTLSEAFVSAWNGGTGYESIAEALRRSHPHPVYQRYIDRRVTDYRAAFKERHKLANEDLVTEMIVLWNRNMFFEVHELLEGHWHMAEGSWRRALQALILAAAVYVHRETGRTESAQKLARRARVGLKSLRAQLSSIDNLDALCDALLSPAAPPPALKRSGR